MLRVFEALWRKLLTLLDKLGLLAGIHGGASRDNLGAQPSLDTKLSITLRVLSLPTVVAHSRCPFKDSCQIQDSIYTAQTLHDPDVICNSLALSHM